jgi:hypothetical protein
MNFTHNNHLTYTIGDRLFGRRETIYENYKVNVGKIDPDHYKNSNWVQEQYRTADLIRKDYGKEFVLMFSGGTDSEICLKAFKKIGAVPRVVFIKFTNGYNEGDLKIARYICDNLGFELEEIEFDILDFYYSGQAWEFSSEIDCRQMAYLSVYHHIKKLQMPAVMGGEMLLKRHVTPTDSQWYYCIRENEDASAMRFSLKYNIPLVNEWFSYTPEMMGYYLEHPTIKWLLETPTNGKLASVTTKNRVLHSYMPDLVKKRKTHGFEKLLGFNGETYNELYKSHVKRFASSLDGILIGDLKQQLFGE